LFELETREVFMDALCRVLSTIAKQGWYDH
jgi:hypothetical protein